MPTRKAVVPAPGIWQSMKPSMPIKTKVRTVPKVSNFCSDS